LRFQFRELRNINNRNENITENVFRFLFLAFRILCVPCSGRRKLTEAEKKENVFVSVFPVNGKRFLYLFLRRTVTGKGKMKTDKPVNLVVRFSFFLLPFSSKRKMQNGQSNGKRKLEQEEYFPFCVLHFGKNEKMYTENSFRFTFLLSVFLRKWNCYFFLFCLPVSVKRRPRKRKLEYVFRSRFPLRFRVKENEKENRQAKTFSSYDFRFSVFVLLFSAMRTETEHRKGIHYPFCVCRFGKSGKAKNVVLLRFFFWFSRKRKNAGFLFNLTFFVFGENEKCFCWHYTVLGSLVTIQCFPMPILRH